MASFGKHGWLVVERQRAPSDQNAGIPGLAVARPPATLKSNSSINSAQHQKIRQIGGHRAS